MREARATALLLAAVALGACAGVALVVGLQGTVADENYYGPQVKAFMEGRWQLVPGITMLPGYHLGIAGLAGVAGPYSETLVRLVNLAGSLAILPLAWRLAAEHFPGEAAMRAAQVFFLPLLFPYLFLIYTEGWSIAALLAMILLAMRGRTWWAALFAILGTVMRQDFVAWVAFAAALVALEGLPPRPSGAEIAAAVRRALPRALPLLLVLAAFVAFVAWNRGIAYADRSRHEAGVNAANVWLFLLCAWVVFLPACLAGTSRALALVRRPAVAAALLAALALYAFAWSNPHIYNQAHLRFFLHNELLYWMDGSAALRWALFVPMAWAALALLSVPLPEPRMRLLLPVAIAAALLHPLVEHRYYLHGFVLLVIWRPPHRPWVEWTTLALYAAAGLLLLQGIAALRFFP